MSKFVELAVANNKEETAKIRAEKAQPILKARVEAKIKAQEAVILEQRVNFNEAEASVKQAQGYITTNVDNFLEGILDIMTIRDEAAEELKEAERLLEDLENILKIFV